MVTETWRPDRQHQCSSSRHPDTRGQLEVTVFSLRISAHDTRKAATALRYTTACLPAASQSRRSRLPRRHDYRHPPCQARRLLGDRGSQDTATGKADSTRFRIVTSAPLNTAASPAGQMPLLASDLCLNDPGTPGGWVTVAPCDPADPGQRLLPRQQPHR